MNETPLYPYSAEEARRRGELSLWRASYLTNIDCKEAIEKAVRQHFDGSYLDEDCLGGILREFGYKRTALVLANTIHQLEWDGRFSSRNKAWAQTVPIPPDKWHDLDFVVTSHPAVLDGVVDQYRQAYRTFDLFGPEHCEPDSLPELDYKGKVLALSPSALKESHWSPQDQLWFANSGFGCLPHAMAETIRATCLADGETTRWNRGDFIGPLKAMYLPDWAKSRLLELDGEKKIRLDRPTKERFLSDRISGRWNAYEKILLELSPQEILDRSEELAAVRTCRDTLLRDMDLSSDEQLTFLLSLVDPVDQLQEFWSREQEADRTEQMTCAMNTLQKELQERQKIETPNQGGMTMK